MTAIVVCVCVFIEERNNGGGGLMRRVAMSTLHSQSAECSHNCTNKKSPSIPTLITISFFLLGRGGGGTMDSCMTTQTDICDRI